MDVDVDITNRYDICTMYKYILVISMEQHDDVSSRTFQMNRRKMHIILGNGPMSHTERFKLLFSSYSPCI